MSTRGAAGLAACILCAAADFQRLGHQKFVSDDSCMLEGARSHALRASQSLVFVPPGCHSASPADRRASICFSTVLSTTRLGIIGMSLVSFERHTAQVGSLIWGYTY
jgi:hypothetical protein